MTKDIPKFCILIDSREQKKYTFESIKPKPKTKIIGLKTGDYSLDGFSNRIVIERKEIGDLFSSIGKNRVRFEKEMIRMSKFDYSCLVIETSLAGIFVNPPSRSKMTSKSVFRTLIAWSQRYHVHVWPMWDRQSAERVTYLLLKRYWDDLNDGKRRK